jgi:4-hydroxy 2-oxovalerate aldolase
MSEDDQKKNAKIREADGSPAGRWITYRPDIKVLDCTIRDGGLMNNHHFDEETVRAVYKACVAAGIDYMELGYKGDPNLFDQEEHGPWKFCDEELMRRVVGDKEGSLKISVMADAERCNYREDILPRSESVVDMVRVATYIHQIPVALDMVKDAHDKGYEVTLNLMALSTVQERELDEALEFIAGTEVDAIYVVDSFGSIYSEQVRYYMRKFMHYAKPAGKQLGMHAHNNQQLAYANTIESIIMGASLLDASMAGLGRGAGNCPLELLIGFLHNPKFKLRPVLACIRDHIEPLRDSMRWGPDIPYMITGLLNQHPRAAMKFNAGEDRMDIVKFFDSIIEED